jgi:hypothetical protein
VTSTVARFRVLSIFLTNAGVGLVWIVDKRGMPTGRIEACAGVMTTNVAFGGT